MIVVFAVFVGLLVGFITRSYALGLFAFGCACLVFVGAVAG